MIVRHRPQSNIGLAGILAVTISWTMRPTHLGNEADSLKLNWATRGMALVSLPQPFRMAIAPTGSRLGAAWLWSVC